MLIGRLREIEELSRIAASPRPEFVAIYGRRRVGKTFLVRQYFGDGFAFHLTGLANSTTVQQLANFRATLVRTSRNEDLPAAPNWFTAFQQLIAYLETLPEGPKIIFLDELPWMDTPKSDFLMGLESFWNAWASGRTDIKLITCGSAASWMTNKLINNRGGLYNRVTHRIRVFPFTLYESEALLRINGVHLSRYDIAQIFMVTGGIPAYLLQVLPGRSVAQNIQRLCFERGAFLRTEFKNLFTALFRTPDRHETVVRALASKNAGLTRTELTKATGLPSGGTMTRLLEELEESGFVSRYYPFGRRTLRYRLSDFYSRFYLKFIEAEPTFPDAEWQLDFDRLRQRAWAGYAFEQICLEHLPQIKRALGIAGVSTQTSVWQYRAESGGAQIDLVIDRRDRVIHLCEVKFSERPYTVTGTYAERLEQRRAIFLRETGTNKSVFTTLITTFGTKGTVPDAEQQVTLDDLFQP